MLTIVTCPRCAARNRVDERADQLKPVCGRCGAALSAAPDAATAEPLTVTDESFSRTLEAAGDRPVLLDCWAEWCGPCRMLTPTINALARESAGRYVIGKLNVDENPGVARQFNISSIPTILIFKRGQMVQQLVGLQNRSTLENALRSHQ